MERAWQEGRVPASLLMLEAGERKGCDWGGHQFILREGEGGQGWSPCGDRGPLGVVWLLERRGWGRSGVARGP